MTGLRGAAPRWTLRLAVAAAALATSCTRVGMTPAPAPRTGPIGRALPEAGTVGVPADAPRPPEPAAAPGGTSRPPVRFEQVRGLWVVRFSLATPQSTRAVVERAAAAGFNTLLVQVRGRGDAYYASGLEPRGAPLASAPAGFDPLAQLVADAHARGMAVHAWVNVALVADATTVPDDPSHLARAHPEALMVPRALARELARIPPRDPRYAARLIEWTRAHRERVEGLYASPANPAMRERTVAVALDLVERYDLDGLHFDYIRYPGPEFDYSAGTLEAFRAWASPSLQPDRRRRLDRASEPGALAWADSLPVQWADFRREQVTTLLERVHLAVKARRPWVVISAAVHPDPEEARQGRFQDWPSWSRSGLLDAVAPMAYTADPRAFRAQIGRAVDAAPRLEMWAGVGSYLAGEAGTLAALEAARELGMHGVVLFSYDWAVSAEGGGGESFLTRIGRAFERGRR